MGSNFNENASHQDSPQGIVSLSQMSRSRIIVSVVGVLLAMLLAALDQTIVATALPRVVADLGGFGQFAWVFTAYMLASTTSIPIMGKLSDIYGRKWALSGGIVVFLLGSILCGFAQNMLQLILFRGVQGLGAGAIIAISYAVVGDVFPPAQRGKWAGVVGAVLAVAVISGPLAGGVVTDHLTWRWIFFINVPTGLLTLAVILGGMADVRDPDVDTRIDYRGLITLIAWVVPLLLALTWAGIDYPWLSVQVTGLLVFSGVMAVLFLLAEGRAWDPLIPRELFTNPIFTIAVLVSFLTAIGMYAAIMLIPLFVQGVTGASATDAGFTLMPAMLSGVISAIIAGQVISRTGRYKLLAIGGVSLMAGGAFLFTRLDAESSRTDAIWFMVIAAVGLGATLPTFMISAQNAFSHNVLGVVTASVQFFRSIGGAVGTAVLGSFLAIRLGDWLAVSLPQENVEALSSELGEMVRDPQAILDPEAMARIRDLAAQGEGGAQALGTVEEGLRAALATAMHDVFLLGLGVMLVAVVFTLFYKEIPLRKTMLEPVPDSEPEVPE